MKKLIHYINDRYETLITIPYERLCRFFYWGWSLRRCHDWDSSTGTYLFIYLKLNKMIKYSKKYGHFIWNSNENNNLFRKLRIASNIAHRLYKNEYQSHGKRHDEKWGSGAKDDLVFERSYLSDGSLFSCISSKSDEGLTDKQRVRKRSEYFKAADNDELQKKNEKKLLHKLLEKHLEEWID